MKPLVIIAILLVVIANAALNYHGNTSSLLEPAMGHGSMPAVAARAHAIPMLPIAGSVALVGISLLMGARAKQIE
jgi:hypothetical protein